MRYTVRQPQVDFEYKTREGTTIDRKNYIVDLGVVMSDTAKFHGQNKKSAANGRGRAGWICRVFNTRGRCEMLTLYKVLVLPLLEYCSPLWSPTELGRIRELENVQRSFTRRIDGLEDLNYWERLKDLKLYSLERRRERYCIIYVWKILNDLAPNFKGDLKIERVYISERNGIKCVVPRTVSHATQRMRTIRENTLRIRGINLFNKLPVELRQPGIGSDLEEPKRINKFKSLLDKILKTIPNQPYLHGHPTTINGNSILDHITRG